MPVAKGFYAGKKRRCVISPDAMEAREEHDRGPRSQYRDGPSHRYCCIASSDYCDKSVPSGAQDVWIFSSEVLEESTRRQLEFKPEYTPAATNSSNFSRHSSCTRQITSAILSFIASTATVTQVRSLTSTQTNGPSLRNHFLAARRTFYPTGAHFFSRFKRGLITMPCISLGDPGTENTQA